MEEFADTLHNTWLQHVLGQSLPREPMATCSNCAMCHEHTQDADAKTFLAETNAAPTGRSFPTTWLGVFWRRTLLQRSASHLDSNELVICFTPTAQCLGALVLARLTARCTWLPARRSLAGPRSCCVHFSTALMAALARFGDFARQCVRPTSASLPAAPLPKNSGTV